MAKNWDKIRNQSVTDTLRNRDVYESQQLDRTKVGQKQSFTSRHIIAICVGVVTAIMVWMLWSVYDMNALDRQSEADANVAVVITEPAPAEPRDLSDVKWANMLLVEDNTYAKYGYTYMDKKTGVKYTQAEYDIWLDVHRRITSGACPEILWRNNADGSRTYIERPAMAPAPEEPRDFSNADYINFINFGIEESSIYKDLGYYYYEHYSNKYLTREEYQKSKEYTEERINELIENAEVTYKKKEVSNSSGIPTTVIVYYDISPNVITPVIPEEAAGTRYYTPIALDDIVWANMLLVEDSSAANLGYTYMDKRTGQFYTDVEYAHWKTIYQNAKYSKGEHIFWVDVSEEDGGYIFTETPTEQAPPYLRERFKSYLTPTLMLMNLIPEDYWSEYGYNYYDLYTLTCFSDVEYQAWLDVQNKVASGELKIPDATQKRIREENIRVTDVILEHLDPLPVKHSYSEAIAYVNFLKVFVSLGIGFMVYALLRTLLKKNLDAQNLMNDTSDINQYENDQHIALPEEVQRKFDWFPDVGAHCPVQVSSMISHMMITNKGLNKIKVAKRAEKDIVDADGDIVYYKGEILCDDKGEEITELLPLIDTQFADELYEASGAPKEVRKSYDPTKIPYNPDGKDRTKQCGTHKTVADAINKTWTFPLYEPQRPAGAYIVDTEPVNTMVLAITRAGKGQTVIEPTIDMWTRETRPNNMVINDPKGELLVKNYVRGTVRGFQIVQFNLINAMKTDIYNPLGMAADAAREGDFTKCAMYVDNVASVFFPVDGADDPVWPNAANNAFKRAAYGLMDYYLEEEKELRREAERINLDPKILETKIDTMWGKVTLYNCYQLFVQLTSKKLKNPSIEFQANAKAAQEYMKQFENADENMPIPPHPNAEVQKLLAMSEEEYDKTLKEVQIKSSLWEDKPEADLLTLYFSATDLLPRNSMRNLVANANNALKSMAGAEKMLASVYGIAITAMSFFTDPTIATLTSGTPSQNVDLAGMSFPRRLGVRFHNDYLKAYHLVGLQVKWSAYEDELFSKPLGKDFEHEDLVTREGWARYYFKGLFPNDVTYLCMQIKNPDTSMLVKDFFFKFEKSYQTSLDGRFFVKDPVLGTKIVKNGILTELKAVRRKSTGEKLYIPRKTTFKRDTVDFMQQSSEKKRTNAKAIIRTMCRYSEKPKMVFLVTPPHLMNYAKLILILIKQLVDLNFDQSYMTKDNQKPLYKTRFMLDELGNLQSEGHGISGFETMLSIGLGQEQQFTLILQTLQQLRDVYGESVDKIVQGNTSNIVFLKSTDDAMIDTLQKMSGVTHKSFTDSKTITRDMQKLMMQNEGKASYTMTTKEVPVISYNDMAFISERNSIIFRAGDSPVWNRNETILPMSWRLFKTTITQPGKNYSLQTIPTLSSALDFDIRQNQPDFIKMLDKRMAQACKAAEAMEMYKTAYNYTDTELAKLDIDAYSDEIMDLIIAMLNDSVGKSAATDDEEDVFGDDVVLIDDWDDDMFEGGYTDEIDEVNSYGAIDESNIENNDDVQQEAAKRQAARSEFERKIYANGYLSKSDLIRPDGSVKTHSFDRDFSEIFANQMGVMLGDRNFFNDIDGNLYGLDGKPYIIRNDNSAMLARMNEAAEDEESNVYAENSVSEQDLNEFNTYAITDAFYQFLASLDTWSFANGRFNDEMARRMEG